MPGCPSHRTSPEYVRRPPRRRPAEPDACRSRLRVRRHRRPPRRPAARRPPPRASGRRVRAGRRRRGTALWRDHRGWGALHTAVCAGGAVGRRPRSPSRAVRPLPRRLRRADRRRHLGRRRRHLARPGGAGRSAARWRPATSRRPADAAAAPVRARSAGARRDGDRPGRRRVRRREHLRRRGGRAGLGRPGRRTRAGRLPRRQHPRRDGRAQVRPATAGSAGPRPGSTTSPGWPGARLTAALAAARRRRPARAPLRAWRARRRRSTRAPTPGPVEASFAGRARRAARRHPRRTAGGSSTGRCSTAERARRRRSPDIERAVRLSRVGVGAARARRQRRRRRALLRRATGRRVRRVTEADRWRAAGRRDHLGRGQERRDRRDLPVAGAAGGEGRAVQGAEHVAELLRDAEGAEIGRAQAMQAQAAPGGADRADEPGAAQAGQRPEQSGRAAGQAGGELSARGVPRRATAGASLLGTVRGTAWSELRGSV